MMSLSSLSKAKLLNAFSLAGCLIVAYILFMTAIAPWWGIAIMVAVAGFQMLILLNMLTLEHEIKRMAHTVGALAKGDFEARLTDITAQGELGDFQWRFNEMVDAVDAFIREATAAMEHVSRNQYFRRILEAGMQGNLLRGARIINCATKSVEEKMGGFVVVANDLDSSLTQVVKQINAAAQDLTNSTDTMQNSVRVTCQEVDAAVRDSNNTSVSVQTISAATEEMSSCIAEVTQQMARTSQIAETAVGESAQARDTIDELTLMADKISDVVGIIKKIAEQTNLLALNATIEAARAGEAGKGFAIVAGEVKQLAGQTNNATKEISELVTDIQGATRKVEQAFLAISSIITEVNEASSIVATAIEEQSAASKEIALSAERASADTNSVAENVRDINQNVVCVGEAASDAVRATGELSENVTKNIHALLDKMGVFMVELRKIA